MRKKRITRSDIARLVKEEARRLQETLELGLDRPEAVSKKVREVDADKLASTVQQCIDHYKQCKLKEAKLIRDLKLVQERKARLKQKILNDLK